MKSPDWSDTDLLREPALHNHIDKDWGLLEHRFGDKYSGLQCPGLRGTLSLYQYPEVL